MPFENIGINLQINADTSQAKQQLQNLQNTLQSINKNPLRFGQTMTQEVQKASQAAAQLQQHLQSATNVNTGTLDFGKFSQSLQKSGHDLDYYGQQLKKLGPEGYQAFQQLGQSVASAEVPIRRSSELLAKMGTTLKNTIRWQISSQVIRGFQSSIQGAFNYAEKLNKSLNNIRIVTGYSTDQMAQFATEANKAARALSTTTTAYTDASLIFYQQGLKGSDVTDRANTVIKLANVTRQSAQEVSDQMTAVWNNFYDGSKSLESYADTLTALGAATASSSAEISQGLEKFAAVARTTGLSYEYATTALATVVAQTRQSADIVGTSFKTLLARLQDLEQGNTLEDGTTLGQYSEALMKVGINIKDQNGQLKQADQILNDMGAKWKSLAQDQKVALAQNVAGVRQYTQLVALMDNWDKFQQNLSVARNSAGTLQDQADIYAESWEAAKKRVQASLETIYDDLVNDDFFIGLNNALAKIVDTLGSVIKGLGGLDGVLLTFGAIATTVFDKQIAAGLEKVVYNIKMSTATGRRMVQEQKLLQMQSLQKNMVGSDFESNNVYNENYKTRIALQQKIVELSGTLNKNQAEYLQGQANEINNDLDQVDALVRKTEELNRQRELKEDALFDNYSGSYEQWRGARVDQRTISSFAEFDYLLKEVQANLGNDEAIKNFERQFRLLMEGFHPEGMEEMLSYLDDLTGEYELSADSLQRMMDIYKQVKKEIMDTAFSKLSANGTKVTEAQRAEFNAITEQRIQTIVARKQAEKAQQNAEKSAKDFGKTVGENNKKTIAWSESVISLARGLSSLGMTINAFQSLSETLKNPELSGWEKFIRILTSIGSIGTSLIFTFTSFGKVIKDFSGASLLKGLDTYFSNSYKTSQEKREKRTKETQDIKEGIKNKFRKIPKASEQVLKASPQQEAPASKVTAVPTVVPNQKNNILTRRDYDYIVNNRLTEEQRQAYFNLGKLKGNDVKQLSQEERIKAALANYNVEKINGQNKITINGEPPANSKVSNSSIMREIHAGARLNEGLDSKLFSPETQGKLGAAEASEKLAEENAKAAISEDKLQKESGETVGAMQGETAAKQSKINANRLGEGGYTQEQLQLAYDKKLTDDQRKAYDSFGGKFNEDQKMWLAQNGYSAQFDPNAKGGKQWTYFGPDGKPIKTSNKEFLHGKGGKSSIVPKAPKLDLEIPEEEIPQDLGNGVPQGVKQKKGLSTEGKKGLTQSIGKGLAVAAAIAIMVGTVKLASDIYNSAENAAKEAEKNAQYLQEQYQLAQEAYDNFKNSVSSYKDARSGIDQLTKGTIEYREAVMKANDEAMKLLATNTDLGYTIDENGLIKIEEKDLLKAQEEQLRAVKRSQAASNLATIQANRKRDQADKVALGRSLDHVSGSDVGKTAGYMAGELAGFTAAGAIIGSLFAPGIGTTIGAALGAAVGATTGGIQVSGGIMSSQESAALEKIYEKYDETGNAMFATTKSFRETMEQDLGINDSDLINALSENTDAIKEWVQNRKQDEQLEKEQWIQAFIAQHETNSGWENKTENEKRYLGEMAWNNKVDINSPQVQQYRNNLESLFNKEIGKQYEDYLNHNAPPDTEYKVTNTSGTHITVTARKKSDRSVISTEEINTTEAGDTLAADYARQLSGKDLEDYMKQYSKNRTNLYNALSGGELKGDKLMNTVNNLLLMSEREEGLEVGDFELAKIIEDSIDAIPEGDLKEKLQKKLKGFYDAVEDTREGIKEKVAGSELLEDESAEISDWIDSLDPEDLKVLADVDIDTATSMADLQYFLDQAKAKNDAELKVDPVKFWDDTGLKKGMTVDEWIAYRDTIEEQMGHAFGEQGSPTFDEYITWDLEKQQNWQKQMQAQASKQQVEDMQAEYDAKYQRMLDLQASLDATNYKDWEAKKSQIGALQEELTNMEEKLSMARILQADKETDAMKQISGLNLGDTIDSATFANLSSNMQKFFEQMEDGSYKLVELASSYNDEMRKEAEQNQKNWASRLDEREKYQNKMKNVGLGNDLLNESVNVGSQSVSSLANNSFSFNPFEGKTVDATGGFLEVDGSDLANAGIAASLWNEVIGGDANLLAYEPTDNEGNYKRIDYQDFSEKINELVRDNPSDPVGTVREYMKRLRFIRYGQIKKGGKAENININSDIDLGGNNYFYSRNTGTGEKTYSDEGYTPQQLLFDENGDFRGMSSIYDSTKTIGEVGYWDDDSGHKYSGQNVDDSLDKKLVTIVLDYAQQFQGYEEAVETTIPKIVKDVKNSLESQGFNLSQELENSLTQYLQDGKSVLDWYDEVLKNSEEFADKLSELSTEAYNSTNSVYGLIYGGLLGNFDEAEGVDYNAKIKEILQQGGDGTERILEWYDKLKSLIEHGLGGDAISEDISNLDGAGIAWANLKSNIASTAAAIEELVPEFDSIYDALDKGIPTTQYINGLSQLQNAVESVFGDVNLTSDFILQNRELIRRAFQDGSEEAFKELQRKVLMEQLSLKDTFYGINKTIVELTISSGLKTGEAIDKTNGEIYDKIIEGIEANKDNLDNYIILLELLGYTIENVGNIKFDKNGKITEESLKNLKLTYTGITSELFNSLNSFNNATKQMANYQVPYLDEIIERYKEINQEITKLNNSMTLLQNLSQRVWGQNRQEVLKAEIEGQKQLLELYKQQTKEAKEYRKTDLEEMQKALSAMGLSGEFQIDAQTGNITNIEDVQRAIYEQEKSIYDTANTMTSENGADYVKNFEEAKKNWDHYFQKYEEDNQKIEEDRQKQQEILFKQQDLQMEKFNHAIEVRNAKDEAEMMILDFYLARIDDSLENADQYVTHYLDKGNQLLKQVSEAEQDIQDLIDLHNNPTPEETISDAQFVEKYKELIENANSAVEALQQWQEEYWTYLNNLFDQVVEKMDEAKKGVQRLTNITSHYQKIWDLVGNPQDYKTKLDLLNTTYQLSKANVEDSARLVGFYVSQLQQTRKELNSIDGETRKNAEETIKKIEEQVYTSIEDMMSAYETALQDAKNQMDATVEQLQKDLEKVWTGGSGFDWLEKQYQWGKDLAENQELSYDRIYETTKLIRKAQDEINKTANKTAQLRLKQFQIETKQMQNQSDLTKFQLSMQQKRYDLLLAQIALENARNAISDVTLRRDANGNFGYVYTTDQEKISEAEQGVEDAENAIRDAQVEEYNAQISDVFSNLKSFYNDATELQRQLVNKEISQEEYDLRMPELQNYYGQKFEQNAVNIRSAISDWGANELEVWMPNKEELNTNFKEISAKLFGSNDFSQGLASFLKDGSSNWFEPLKVQLGETSNQVKKAIGQYQDKTTEMADSINKLSQIDFFDVSKENGAFQMSEATSKIEQKLKDWTSSDYSNSISAVIENLKDVYPEALTKFSSWWSDNGTKFQNKFEEMFKAYTDYKTSIESVGNATEAVANAIEEIKPDYYDYRSTYGGPNNWYQGGSSSGSGSGNGLGHKTPPESGSQGLDIAKYRSNKAFNLFKHRIQDPEGNLDKIDSLKGALDNNYFTKSNVLDYLDYLLEYNELIKNNTIKKHKIKTEIEKINGYTQTKFRDQINNIVAMIDSLFETSEKLDASKGDSRFRTYDTGGYTGEWGPEGKVAILHEKELVLNATDTKNFLNALSLTDAIMQSLDRATAQFNYQGQIQTASLQSIQKDKIEQSIQIEANFPNVTNHEEIEIALNNLVNTAAQYAFAGD